MTKIFSMAQHPLFFGEIFFKAINVLSIKQKYFGFDNQMDRALIYKPERIPNSSNCNELKIVTKTVLTQNILLQCNV